MPDNDQRSTDDGWIASDAVPPVDGTVDIVDLAVAEHVAHPTRGRLLRRLKRPQSVAELADSLGVPVTRLYHHMKLLESGGLIRVVATRQVGAATERRYQATAQSYRLPEALVADTAPDQLGHLLGSVFDLAKLELVDFVEGGGMSTPNLDQQMALSLSHVELTAARRTEFLTALLELLSEYTDDPVADDAEPFTLFVAAFPPSDAADS